MTDPKTALALIPTTVSETVEICEMYAGSSLLPDAFRAQQTRKADLFLAITYGMDLGFSPAAALRAVCVIKGKPGLYADAMVALVLSSGKARFFRSIGKPGEAIYETGRVGERKTQTKSFSTEDAKRARLAGDNWTKYPQHMLEARAKSWLARDCYPDVLHGVYSSEELQELEPANSSAGFEPVSPGAVMAAAIVPRENVKVDKAKLEIVEATPEPAPEPEPALSPEDFAVDEPEPEGDPGKPTLLEQLEQAEDIPSLKKVGLACADVVDLDERTTLRTAFAARLAELKACAS